MSDSDLKEKTRAIHHHPQQIDADLNTPLHYAAATNYLEKTKQLIEKKRHLVDPENYLGWTPLMMACHNGHFEMVKYLILRRANATKLNKYGMNVFQIALVSGNLELINYLLNHFLTGGISRRILERNCPVLVIALLIRREDILQFLIENHFDVNGKTPKTEITPFMFAHALEFDSAIVLLLKHNADITMKNYLSHTAMDISLIRQNLKLNTFSPNLVNLSLNNLSAQQEYLQNEMLRNALKLNSSRRNDNGNNPASAINHQQLLQRPQQVPFIIVSSPALYSTNIENIIPSSTPKDTNAVNPAGIGQVFFPPNFSVDNLQNFNVIDLSLSPIILNMSSFLNQRINGSSAADLYMSNSALNFSSA